MSRPDAQAIAFAMLTGSTRGVLDALKNLPGGFLPSLRISRNGSAPPLVSIAIRAEVRHGSTGNVEIFEAERTIEGRWLDTDYKFAETSRVEQDAAVGALLDAWRECFEQAKAAAREWLDGPGKEIPRPQTFTLSAEQVAKLAAWQDEQEDIYRTMKHLGPNDPTDFGAIGGPVTFEITPTSVCDVVKARHYFTGAELDLTDYENL